MKNPGNAGNISTALIAALGIPRLAGAMTALMQQKGIKSQIAGRTIS